jgi:hypothetical protein
MGRSAKRRSLNGGDETFNCLSVTAFCISGESGAIGTMDVLILCDTPCT